MAENRVVQGRMVTPESLAELIEGESVLGAEAIEDAGHGCPDCEGNVVSVVYMASVTETVTGEKCQECDWAMTDRDGS
ncbi:hypothetical protein BRD17_01630 [Halobacteriales archaeon SW_7_68_16]|nr:MAG: hypothetical protein BRD17_01630 [Halobacteriales archaeon SW_7_68_16]